MCFCHLDWTGLTPPQQHIIFARWPRNGCSVLRTAFRGAAGGGSPSPPPPRPPACCPSLALPPTLPLSQPASEPVSQLQTIRRVDGRVDLRPPPPYSPPPPTPPPRRTYTDAFPPCLKSPSSSARAQERERERDQSMNLRPLARPPSLLPSPLPSYAALFIHARIRSTRGSGRGSDEGSESRSRHLGRGRRTPPVLRAREAAFTLSHTAPSFLPCLPLGLMYDCFSLSLSPTSERAKRPRRVGRHGKARGTRDRQAGRARAPKHALARPPRSICAAPVS